METLRKANGYRTRWYCSPDDFSQPVPAYSQNEYQVSVQPGSYVWGVALSAPDDLQEELTAAASYLHVQVTDACTETPLFSDYVPGQLLDPLTFSTNRNGQHYPMLTTPMIVGQPGLLDVEIYNSAAQPVYCQFVLFVAEPVVPPEEIKRMFERAGIEV
jgi:hypothetical protein